MTTQIPVAILSAVGLVPAPYPASSIAAAAAYEPSGVYTVGRTFRRDHCLLFAQHLARLQESARLEGINAKFDALAVRAALKKMIDVAGYAESRFKLSIPRHAPNTMILSVEPFVGVPAELAARGVKVATLAMARANPKAKVTDWIGQRAAAVAQAGLPSDAYETILLAEGGLFLEGTSSNFYAVAGNVLYTATEGVLQGLAQHIVLKVAPTVLPLAGKPFMLGDLPTLQECFLSSASRGVLPIVQIDDRVVGAGVPGPITLAIRAQYEAWAEANLEPLV
jgi:branched-chain amino acid aminotransferase